MKTRVGSSEIIEMKKRSWWPIRVGNTIWLHKNIVAQKRMTPLLNLTRHFNTDRNGKIILFNTSQEHS